MSLLRFAKYEGLGNDFIVVDGLDVVTPEQAVRLCDRHLGVGADGVLLVGAERGLTMRVVNADGSTAEMCGNGIRCVALHLARQGVARVGDVLTIATDAGPHRCELRDRSVAVDMAIPSLEPADVPVAADAPLIDAALDVAGRSLRVTAVSMGNPHAVTFDDVGDARAALGPALERDARFPNGVNAGFGAFHGDVLALSVFERGVGWTRACGTGACAAAVAAVETGRAGRGETIVVRLPGGDLRITVREPGLPVNMDGPARHVFDGEVELVVPA